MEKKNYFGKDRKPLIPPNKVVPMKKKAKLDKVAKKEMKECL